ncbi:MAG TPA: LPS assembly lipoprotein LptE [Saprospiraceae bacterium]|nr:LPS assembly lipoprotein LptE [Saprospiraceae bacterium]
MTLRTLLLLLSRLSVRSPLRSLLLLLPLLLTNGCYSLKGISIDARVNTFFVNTFETVAINAPPTLNINYTERMKNKIRSETRLKFVTENADVNFSGKILDYRVVPVAPKPGETVALNQLVIVVQVSAENMKEEKIEWPKEKSFSHFAEFSNSTDLLSVQDQLVDQIGDQLLEDIFNYYFNNW